MLKRVVFVVLCILLCVMIALGAIVFEKVAPLLVFRPVWL